ncbi:hypothetical protein BDZ89DRAFT_1163416 [Hymenopellis radicata]|nr:hypothetical protein BDZ89DRAFT_1163416 [Hymenopellis radicata]
MGSTVQFEVDDTSPMITYFPFGDTFSTANLSAGWNPYFDGSGFLSAPGETGSGTSQHISARDGASLVIQWHGTGIELYGNATDASYSISIDNSSSTSDLSKSDSTNNVLSIVNNLSNSDHTLTLTAHTTSTDSTQSFVAFDRALITSTTPNSTAFNNSDFTLQTIMDSGIKFDGQWTFNNGLGNAFRESNTTGDAAHVAFLGTSFLVMGTTSPDGGNYSVTLDNTQIFLSARSSFTNNETLLFYSSGLDPTVVHNLSISNVDGSHLILPVGGFRAFATMNPNPTASATSSGSDGSSPYPAGTIAALVLAGVLVLVLLAWLLFYLLVYRPRMRGRRHNGHGHSGSLSKEAEAGVLDIRPRDSLPTDVYHPRRVSTGSEFKRWKRNAEGHGNLGIDLVFRHPDSTKEVDDHGNPAKSSDVPAQSQGKGKGKSTRWSKFGRHEKEGSSPGFTVDLPLPPEAATTSRQESRNGSVGRDSRSSGSARSYLSNLSTLQLPLVLRSRKSIHRTSNQKPLPQFQGASASSPVREGGQTQPPPTTSLPRILVDDRGSVRYSQNALSRFGRQSVLRGLGPRTSERTPDSPQNQAIFQDPPPRPSRRPDVSPVLDMRESSPFRVDFGSAAAQRTRLPSGVGSAVGLADPSSSKRASGTSHVRFEFSDTSTTGDSTGNEATSPVEEAQTPRPTPTPERR